MSEQCRYRSKGRKLGEVNIALSLIFDPIFLHFVSKFAFLWLTVAGGYVLYFITQLGNQGITCPCVDTDTVREQQYNTEQGALESSTRAGPIVRVDPQSANTDQS